MPAKLSQEQAVRGFIKVHGDKYDYSKVKYVSAHKKVEIICSIHGSFWQTPTNHFYCKKNCPFCTGRYLTKEQSLQIANPNLAKQWNFEKNGNLTPLDVARSANKKAWWKCDLGHDWEATINSRDGGRGCPFCDGKKVSELNNLEKLYPTLSKEWHPTKNKGVAPKSVVAHTHKMAWWVCSKGHEWNAQIKSRTLGGNGCPYCSGLFASPEYNFELLHPLIAKEWDYSKNITPPNSFSPQANKPVWWVCKLGHEWNCKISSRVSTKSGCPVCNESRGEKEICRFLTENQVSFIRQKRFSKCKHIRQLRFDFFIPKFNILLEYQGGQHFYPVEYFGGKDAFEKLRIRDGIKKDFANTNGFEFIEITYQEFDMIEEILSRKLLV